MLLFRPGHLLIVTFLPVRVLKFVLCGRMFEATTKQNFDVFLPR